MHSATTALYRALDPTGNRDYDELPDSIKMHVTLKEYMWLGQEGRYNLMRDFTEPDWTED